MGANLFKNYINFKLLNIKKYIVKGKIIHNQSSQVDYGHYKNFQITAAELKTCFKHQRCVLIKKSTNFNNNKLNFIFKGLEYYKNPLLGNNTSKKNVDKFSKRWAHFKFLRKCLFYKKFKLGRCKKKIYGGFNVNYGSTFSFMPQSQSIISSPRRWKQKNYLLKKKLVIIPLKALKLNLYKYKHINCRRWNLISSLKEPVQKMFKFNKNLNSKRIKKLNTFCKICN